MLSCLLLVACSQPAADPSPAATSAPTGPTASPLPSRPAPDQSVASVPASPRPSVPASPRPGAPMAPCPCAADGLGDPYYPLLGNGGYDVLHYTIELDVQVEENYLEGSAILDARATEELAAFNLDLLGLEVSAIEVDGESAEFSRAGSELTVRPAVPIAVGAPFDVTVSYAGVPQPVDDPAVPFDIGWLASDGTIYTVSEPSGSMNWYPVNNHPTDKATYTFRITVPQPYVVAANGLLIEEIAGEGTTTYLWESADPIASYLTTVNIDEFEVILEEGPDGLPLRTYLAPGANVEIIVRRFSDTGEMIAFISDLLGPYPFEAYGAVVIDADFPAALETQTLPIYGKSSVRESTILHELAHQWLGNSVTPATWQDIWLNEGFASYFEALWLEHVAGPEALEEHMSDLYGFISSANLPPPGDPSAPSLFGPSVYVRGAWTLHALRLEVGDEAFFEILRTYYDRHKYGNASTADFIAVSEEVAARDLSDFFQSWLYDQSVPE